MKRVFHFTLTEAGSRRLWPTPWSIASVEELARPKGKVLCRVVIDDDDLASTCEHRSTDVLGDPTWVDYHEFVNGIFVESPMSIVVIHLMSTRMPVGVRDQRGSGEIITYELGEF